MIANAKLLTIVGRGLGYCGQCNNPGKVVFVALRGWHHRFMICSVCLRDFAKSADDADAKAVYVA